MNYEIIDKKRIFTDFYQIDKVHLRIERFNNENWGEIKRYNIERPEAAAVILENVSRNKIILVNQFRFGTLKNSSQNGWATEIIAGLIDRGESPEACVIREAMEEAGYRLKNIEPITNYFASIGITDELIHLFYAKVEDQDRLENGGGLPEENEDLEIIEMDFSQLMALIKKGEIKDAKTIIAAQYLALIKAGYYSK